jgi:signal transduction histidine kinase
MKKKIYIIIFFLILCFITGGYYISKSIDLVTNKLETIITLNKVGFLREALLNKIVVVQADLLLKDTPHARQVGTFVDHAEEMHKTATQCMNCHHEEDVKEKILLVEEKIDKYLKVLSRIYTLRANEERLKEEKKEAFDIGQETLDTVNRIVIRTQHKTSQRIQQARNSIKQSERLLYALMIIVPIIILFTTFYFFKNFTGSVLALNQATKELNKGHLSFRIKNNLKDEFHELAISFNEMAHSLKKQRVKIKQAERLAAVGELSAGLAHEIKNPLAGIKVSIQVLNEELDIEPEDKEIFSLMINEIQRIESLLKNLLNYARPATPQPDFINIHDIFESIIKTSEITLKNPESTSGLIKNVQFIRDFSEDVPIIYADGSQLKQVFLNLILNGCDAIDEKGVITIKTTKISAESVEIRISDTGKGIPPWALEKIFNPFFTTKSKGSGLGLAISKRLLEQHNGTINIANNPEGGVTFSIILPIKQESDGVTHEV